MERRSTFRPEDEVIPKLKSNNSSIKEPQFPEEIQLGPIYACLGSSKQFRGINKNIENEDRVCLSKITLLDEDFVFIGLFDGHGGGGKASSFVCKRICETFEKAFSDLTDKEDLPVRISIALENSFSTLDSDFHKEVKLKLQNAANNGITKIKTKNCCRYFNEDPCLCMNPPISANEGSTGTVILVNKNYVFTANVGDSDAFLVTDITESTATPDSTLSLSTTQNSDSEEVVDSRKRPKLDSRTTALHLDQITVTDTPIADEQNEDYLRIRAVAQKSAPSISERVPVDGILKSARGDRYNYVAVPGARSLNMVRAFGNLGNKRFVNNEIVELESPIISRPHIKVVKRDVLMRAIIVASDGLWDNVEKSSIIDVIGKHLSPELELDGNSPSLHIAERTKSCAQDLLRKAILSKRKPDDVSIVLVPLFGEVLF